MRMMFYLAVNKALVYNIVEAEAVASGHSSSILRFRGFKHTYLRIIMIIYDAVRFIILNRYDTTHNFQYLTLLRTLL
jgi:hypothetical protein